MGRLPDTQLEAWKSIRETRKQARQVVLDAIKKLDGATLFELVQELEWPVNQISGRVTELQRLKFIVDSGKTRVNPETGRRGIIWAPKEENE